MSEPPELDSNQQPAGDYGRGVGSALHGPGTWEVRCTCGWDAATDHETHVWQLSRPHHLEHWVDDPPAFQWHYRCACAWLSGWHGIKSELAAAVKHHRARADRVARFARQASP